ncbi:MAG: diguanylate cyclase, partial [Elusimicrobia bacterium]|nr:diguanylate cyclase [Candidatus Obscuribacterium magneticum]
MQSIRTRILVFFSFYSLAFFVATYVGSRIAHLIASDADTITSKHLPMVHSLHEMQVSLNQQDDAMYRYLDTKDPVWLDLVESERANFLRYFAEAESGATEMAEKDKLTLADQLYDQYDNQVRQILLNASHGLRVARSALVKAGQFLQQIQALVDNVGAMRDGMTAVHQQKIKQTLRFLQTLTISLLVSIVLLFVLLNVYLWRFLVRPLSLLVSGIREFTRGRTDVQIPPVGKDELGVLQEAFNEMSRELNDERKRLRSESQSDALTGLYNMRYTRAQLLDEFSRSQRYGHPLSLLMIDIDYFKAYNDRNGHPAGDIVLKEVGRILTRSVRGTDVVARYGGEEFVILLPETTPESAVLVGEKIRRT